MDFAKLLGGVGGSKPLDPRDIYASLPQKMAGYGYLRDVQGQVLSNWHGRRSQRDLVIKVNTGGGKTIDGLLILRSLANEGLGPALYVAPDRYLVDQVLEEARRLGLRTTSDPEQSAYLSGEAIGVVNAYRLMNGRSIFSNNRMSKPPVPIGSVVIDDVHAALVTTASQMAITLKLSHPVAIQLFELFEDSLREQSGNDVLDIRDRSLSALARVPFWVWRTKLEQAREILHAARDDIDLRFSWPAVGPVLELCQVVFTGRDVSITPPCPPISHITSFAEAKRRVYLTATLADDSILVRDMSADPESVRTPIVPVSAGDIGERMILAPEEISAEISAVEAREAIASLSQTWNVVVLVPSDRAVNNWLDYGPRVVHADDVASTVSDLRSHHVGLVVLVNKYDGIDLPGPACRVLVLDGLPEIVSGDERVESMLRRYEGADDRQVQRIEQGMGRGVRSNEDHCVVFLLGARLGQLVAAPTSLARFGSATRAQLELSKDVAAGLEGGSMADVIGVARQALDRDQMWVTLARERVSAIPAATGFVRESAVANRVAFEKAADRDYNGAAQELAAAANELESQIEAGILLEQRAAYLDHVDPAGAQEVLAAARKRNSYTLRPVSGVVYRQLNFVGSQAQRAALFLGERYESSAALRLGFQGLLDDLVFDAERTSEHEAALAALGLHLGLEAERPEKELGRGPDVLWALGDMAFWVIEAKSGAETTTIKKTDANQLSGSLNWFREKYGTDGDPVPVMVHQARQLAKDASAAEGMRVLTKEGLERLRENVIGFSTGLAAGGQWNDPRVLTAQLKGRGLRVGDLSSYLRQPQKSQLKA